MAGNHRSPEESPLDAIFESHEVLQKLIDYDDALDAGVEFHLEDDDTIRLLPPETRLQIQKIRETLDLLHSASACLDSNASRTKSLLEPVPFKQSVNEQLVSKFGRFEIIRELGHGSYGIVFLAFDPMLGRQVALKILNPAANISPQIRRRFLCEGKTLAKFKHPRIASVHEAGEVNGICYLVQSYCRGKTLKEWLQTQSAPIACRPIACLVAEICDAVEYAHQQGILHRDIKPSNVILVPKEGAEELNLITANHGNEAVSECSFIPMLVDFGVAKSLEQDPGATATDGALGTAQYMSPEQATGQTEQVGCHSDVFSLGIVLYELLTERLPVTGTNPLDTIQQMARIDIQSVRHHRRDIPIDLEAICLKCLRKNPAHRYQTATELAIDLRRFLQGQKVTARQDQFRQQHQSRLLAIAKIGLLSLVLVSLITAGNWLWARLFVEPKSNLSNHVQLQRPATGPEEDSLGENYADEIAQAYLWVMEPELSGSDRVHAAEKAEKILTRNHPLAGQSDQRDFEWYYLWRLLHPWDPPPQLNMLNEIAAHVADAYFTVFSPDGLRIATCGLDRTARIWDVKSGELQLVLDGHQHEVDCVRFSNDGAILATASEDGTVALWNAESGQKIQTVWEQKTPVVGVAFHPINNELAAGAADGTVRVWNLSNPTTELHRCDHGPRCRIESMNYSRDGRFLATSSNVDGVKLWDAQQSYVESKLLGERPNHVESVCFSSDSRLIAASGGNRIHIWNAVSGQLLATQELPESGIRSMQFHEDDRFLLIAGRHSTPILLDWYTGRYHNTFHLTPNNWGTAFSPNGDRMSMTDSKGTLYIWDSSELKSRWRSTLKSEGAISPLVSLSADGSLSAIADRSVPASSVADSNLVTVWDASTPLPKKITQLVLPTEILAIQAIAFSPDASELAVVATIHPQNTQIYFFDPAVGRMLSRSESVLDTSIDGPIRQLLYSADGSTLITAHDLTLHHGAQIRLWGRERGNVVSVVTNPAMRPSLYSEPMLLQISPCGGFFATPVVHQHWDIELFRFSDLTKVLTTERLPDIVRALAVDPNCENLIANCTGGKFSTFSLATGQKKSVFELKDVRPRNDVNDVAFSPSGRLFAFATDNAVALIRFPRRNILYSIPFKSSVHSVENLQFSPNGMTLTVVLQTPDHRFQTLIWRVAESWAENRQASTKKDSFRWNEHGKVAD